MIDLNGIKEIYLYAGFTDFRYGIYGLTKLVLQEHERNLIKHNLYIFCSKSKKGLKILEIDENGVWLYYKKLDVGKYIYPDGEGKAQINKENLKVLIKGLDFVYKIEGKTDKKYDVF